MDEHSQRQAARDADKFRQANESIDRGQWPGEPDKVMRFRCECSAMGCNEVILVSLQDYEEVRQSARRFIIAHGHLVPEVAKVVAETPGYLIVEMTGVAGDHAAASDRRAASGRSRKAV